MYQLSIRHKNRITDEATLFIDNDKQVRFIKGDNNNIKITYKTDIRLNKTYFGIGFDIHKLINVLLDTNRLYTDCFVSPYFSGYSAQKSTKNNRVFKSKRLPAKWFPGNNTIKEQNETKPCSNVSVQPKKKVNK